MNFTPLVSAFLVLFLIACQGGSTGGSQGSGPDPASGSAMSQTTITIDASAGVGGSISPQGSVAVPVGSDQAFAIAANAGYQIDALTLDGVVQDGVGGYTLTDTYTFPAVTIGHSISVTFAPINAILVLQDVSLVSVAGAGGQVITSTSAGIRLDTAASSPPHWILDSSVPGNYYQFSFFGKHSFNLHWAGVGGAFVYASVNSASLAVLTGQVEPFQPGFAVWNTYSIPATAFTTSTNVVQVYLTLPTTALWVDEVWTD